MNERTSSNKLNLLGKFTDNNLENEFFQQDMQKALRFIKPIILVLGILNVLFLIPDYIMIFNKNAFIQIAALRMIFILLIIILYIRIRSMKDFKLLPYLITFYEIFSIFIFLFVFYQYGNPNYLIQAFGVMVIIISIFLVPNSWINMIIVSLLVSLSFIVMSVLYIENIKPMEFCAGIVYISIVIILSSITAFRNQHSKRIQYVYSKELIRLSTTDHLTGAYNRIKLDYELDHWVTHSKKDNTPFSVIILDFDDFKKVNDTYGHLIGDSVIIESVNLILKIIRENDVFARWGGEEFVLLLPNTDKPHAVEMAERLRNVIASHAFKDAGKLTCSFGVVQLANEDDIKSLLYKVDQMLYAAKKDGKNTVKS